MGATVDQYVVLCELRQLAMGTWASDDVALLVGVRERRVRAAIGWLVNRGLVEWAGVERRYTPRGDPYDTKVYRLTGKVRDEEKTPADWRGLYAVFGLRG